jgi:hypothetical protein
MATSRKIVVALLLALMLLVPVQSAPAASSETTTDKIVRGTVEWTLTPDQCPHINLPINGTGQRLDVIATRAKSDGSKEIIENDFVNGTAVDTKGRTYYFVYTNQNRQLVPPDGSPITVHMIDTFTLTGNRGDNNLNVSFVWRWTYSPPEQIFPPVHNWQKEFTLGNPLHCDPI